MKKILLLTFMLASMASAWAAGFKTLNVDLRDGSSVAITLAEDLAISFDTENMVAESAASGKVEISRNDIVGMSHGSDAAIGSVDADVPSIEQEGRKIVVSGVADGTEVSIYRLDGRIGTVSYTAIAYNAQGASVPATANARSGLDYDLAVTDISADPVKVVAGESFTIKATVLNNGRMPTPDDDANRYTVVLREVTDNDRVALDSSFGDRLMSEESAEFSFVCATNDESVGVHRYEVSAMFPDATLDENSDNNVSKIIEVVVEAAQHDGIAAVGADSAIEINGRQITLRAAGAIYNVAGVCVFTNYFDAPRSVTLPAGIYLINIDNKILKVII